MASKAASEGGAVVAQSGGIGLGPVAAADAHIERPGAAVVEGGLLETDDEIAPFWRPSQIGTARRSTPPSSKESLARRSPLPVTTRTILASWCCARRRKPCRAGCASCWRRP